MCGRPSSSGQRAVGEEGASAEGQQRGDMEVWSLLNKEGVWLPAVVQPKLARQTQGKEERGCVQALHDLEGWWTLVSELLSAARQRQKSASRVPIPV